MPTHLGGVKKHLVVHLDLPQEPGDLGVGHGHEHHVVDSKKWHQHQRGLEQLPERRDLSRSPGPAGQPPAPQCPPGGGSRKGSELQSQASVQPSCRRSWLPLSCYPSSLLQPFPHLCSSSTISGSCPGERAAHEALVLPALACTAAGDLACLWWSPRAWRPTPGQC